MFRKRHYKAIAQLLNTHTHHHHPARQQTAYSDLVLHRVIEDFAAMFGDDNPRFDREKFVKAAGY